MGKYRKWMTGAILTALVLVVVVIVMRPSPLGVEVGQVTFRPLTITVEEQGRTRARDPYIVAAPISGRLLRSELDEGDKVSRGQIIARIALAPDDRRTLAIYQAELTAAQARHAAGEAALMEAQSAFSRALKEEERRGELFKSNLISSEEMDTYRQQTDVAEARLRSVQASLEASAAEVESARSRLLGMDADSEEAVHQVSSPVDGTIYRSFEDSERVVQAGTSLYAISNDDRLEIVIDLLTQDAVQVEPEDPILISGWGGEQTLSARVSYVEPEAFTKVSALGVEEQRVNVIAELLETPETLGAGYRIEAAIVIWEQENVLTVPVSAVFQRGDSWHTFVAQNGKVELRPLQLGRRNRDFAQVIGGIEEGELVILYPSDLVSEGVNIEY